jgi:hypothetical protein
MTLYTDRKPREAIAVAILKKVPIGYGMTTVEAFEYATVVLNLIRLNGWGSDLLLDAIHAEEDANGEPRSSVVPGVKT